MKKSPPPPQPQLQGSDLRRPLVAIVEGRDRFFLYNRRDLALHLVGLGYQVVVAANDTGKAQEIRELGFDFINLNAHRGGLSFLKDLLTLRHLFSVYGRCPSLVHHFTLKPVIFGSLLSYLFPSSLVVNSITGLGYFYTDMKRERWKRNLTTLAYKLCFARPRSHVVVQNRDDFDYLSSEGMVGVDKMTLVKGSGVNLERFPVRPEPSQGFHVLFVGRLLEDKGIVEYVEAARQVQQRRPDIVFHVVGDIDRGHPTHIAEDRLQHWVEQGWIRYHGYSDQVHQWIADSHLVVLPSYREGLPKVLLEACATGRAIIGSDVPGCREITRHGQNGYLVPVRQSAPIAEAVLALAEDPVRRAHYAQAARRIVEEEFSSQKVAEQITAVYHRLGLERPPGIGPSVLPEL